ncbi:MAG: hypothetical protein AB7E79_15560 [Rhodospirillaceae bacterium]
MAGAPVRGTGLWVPILVVMVAVIFGVFWLSDEPAPPPAAETIQEAPK